MAKHAHLPNSAHLRTRRRARSAAKAGIVGFVRTWAMEMQRANVTVNALIPVAATAMTDTIPARKPSRRRPQGAGSAQSQVWGAARGDAVWILSVEAPSGG